MRVIDAGRLCGAFIRVNDAGHASDDVNIATLKVQSPTFYCPVGPNYNRTLFILVIMKL